MALDLLRSDATELVRAIRAREVSSLELVDGYLERIARLDPPLNAVVTLDAERARERARTLDDELARGIARGPLHGLPMTIKDAYETEGLRTVCGAPALASHVPARNATAVQRLLDAGAVVLGKTNVPIHCGDLQTFNAVFGTTRNPFDLERTPGGSSGGAAVAVACGMTSFELGSDIGGSIRTPACWTGIYGHKPSFDIVPMRGHIPPPPGSLAIDDLAVAGPLARSARDLMLMLSLIAGPEVEVAKAYRFALPPPRAQALRDFRVGVWLDDPAFPIERDVCARLEAVVQALERAGVRVERQARIGVGLREIVDEYLRLLLPVTLHGVPSHVLDRLASRAAQLEPGSTEAAIASAQLVRHVDWIEVNERRAKLRAHFAALFERIDVLLCPVVPVPAITHQQPGTLLTRMLEIDGVPRPHRDLLAWICPATACYLPATVAPIERTSSGLPLGVQIIGPHLEDLTPIAFAQCLSEVIGGFVPPPGA